MRTGLAARVLALAIVVLLGGARALEAAPILVGTLGGGGVLDENCIPFGCPSEFGIGTYQQVYSSAVFGGPTLINSISFFDTFDSLLPTSPNAVATGTYSLRLSTTAAAVNALSTTLPVNVGADDTLFFTGALGGPIGGTRLTFLGTPFLYDPADGNLLLQVLVSGAGARPFTFFDSDLDNGLFSRAFSFDPSGFQDNVGLVTEFNTEVVPEPATLILLGSGLALLARARRRRTHAR